MNNNERQPVLAVRFIRRLFPIATAYNILILLLGMERQTGLLWPVIVHID
ncbi:MAG TPA: hypothetical protein VHS80_07725 [Chthoniobacterales bacterium]|jgi:hypothetical protein|nr:hypothetical protein [Chthoniobacterales bacterium]